MAVKPQKRMNYSIARKRSIELARYSINMSEDTGKRVPRQTLLDCLIAALSDKVVYERVRKIVSKEV